MRGRMLAGVAVFLLTLGLASSPVRSQELVSAGLDADEAKIEELIGRMGHDEYKIREAATKELQSLGPEIVPVLRGYINHKDPEIAIRVSEVINSYTWMKKGALIFKLTPGSPAAKAGVKLGDVIVRVGDLDITGFRDIKKIPAGRQTFHLWRPGQILQVQAPGSWEQFGATVLDWDFDKGGNDHARGMAALARNHFEEAYRRLWMAYQGGMRDILSMVRLWGLAEYHLDHKRATLVNEEWAKLGGGFQPYWCSFVVDWMCKKLPVTALYTEHLLDRMKPKPPSSKLYAEAIAYFAGRGQNLPLALHLYKRTWPQPLNPGSIEWGWKRKAVGDILLHEESPKNAIDAMPQGPMSCYSVLPLARLIASYTKPEMVTSTARDILKHLRKKGSCIYCSRAVAYLLASALARGTYRESGLEEALMSLPPSALGEILSLDSDCAFRHTGISPELVSTLEKILEKGDSDQFTRFAYLGLLRYQETLTLKQWDRAFARHGKGVFQSKYWHWLNAMTLLRFGQYDRARRAVRKFFPKYAGLEAFHRAADFLEANRARLEKDWKQLKGVYQMYDGLPADCRWAVRYDGRTFFINKAGKVTEFPGLAPGQTHQAINGDQIFSHKSGTVYVRRCQIYVLDQKEKRWVRTYASPCTVPSRAAWWKNPTAPVVLTHLVTTESWVGPGREQVYPTTQWGGWDWYQFNGDFAIAVNARTHAVLDVSGKIARMTGKGEFVRVHRVGRLAQDAVLIPTEVGPFRMDADGTIKRYRLPVGKPAQMVRVMSYPKRKGKTYLGIVPQQGGQVYEIDLDSGDVKLTGGYCGYGPADAYAAFQGFDRLVHCEYVIQMWYEKRLEREKAGAGE